MDIVGWRMRKLFFLKDFLFNGGDICRPYKELKRFDSLPYEKAKALRDERLKRFLTYVRENSKYYSKINSSDLNDYPVVNKKFLIEHYSEIAVDEAKVPGQDGKMHIQSTSGSTGTPFKVAQDTLKRKRRIAELKYFGEIVGFLSHEMLVHLRTWNRWQQKTKKQIKEERIIPFDISNMGENRLEELCKCLNESKAVCIRGYASSLGELANYVQKHPQSFPYLKIAIAGSEALIDDVRAKVKKYLRCEIISQYADEECGILAQEKVPTKEKDNPMYFNNAGYVLEVLKQDSDVPAEYGEVGRIVITDLYNQAFPIIRYDTGDVCVLGPADDYSNGWPIIEKLYGRRFDMCYTTEGDVFSPMAVGRTLKHFEWIKQWQFIQKGEKDYELRISVRDAHDDFNEIVSLIKEQLGEDANVVITQVDEIPVLASGKRKVVVNEWKK